MKTRKLSASQTLLMVLTAPILLLPIACQTGQGGGGIKSFQEDVFVRKEARIDPSERMGLLAQRLKSRGAPTPSWKSMVDPVEMDDIRAVGPELVLAGLVNMREKYPNSSNLSPDYGPYVLVNAATGRIVWQHPRKPDLHLSYSILGTAPHLIYSYSDGEKLTLTGVHMATGQTMWEKKLSPKSKLAVAGEAGIVVIAEADERNTLTAIDLNTGKKVWRLTDEKLGTLPALTIQDNALVVGARVSSGLDLKTGRMRWTCQEAGPVESEAMILPVSNGTIIPTTEGRLCRIDGSGKAQWMTSLPATPLLLATDGSILVVESMGNGPVPHLTAVDLTSGTRIWSISPPGALKSPMAFSQKALAFSTRSTVQAIDPLTGKTLFSVPLQETSDQRLPDHIVLFPDHLSVATETTVSAYALPNGETLWHFDLTAAKDRMTYTHRQFYGDKVSKAPPNPVLGMIEAQQSRALSRQQWADQRLNRAYQNYHNRRSEYLELKSRNSDDKDYAYGRMKIAATNVDVTRRINNSFNQARFAIDTAVNAYFMGAAIDSNIQQGADLAEKDKDYMKRIVFANMHLNALQEPYYVHPFNWERGFGIVLINLENGAWSEVVTSPFEHKALVSAAYCHLMMGRLTDDRQQLITFGTGLDRQSWHHFRGSAGLQLTRRFLMAYPLADLKMNPASSYQKQSITNWVSKAGR